MVVSIKCLYGVDWIALTDNGFQVILYPEEVNHKARNEAAGNSISHSVVSRSRSKSIARHRHGDGACELQTHALGLLYRSFQARRNLIGPRSAIPRTRGDLIGANAQRNSVPFQVTREIRAFKFVLADIHARNIPARVKQPDFPARSN